MRELERERLKWRSPTKCVRIKLSFYITFRDERSSQNAFLYLNRQEALIKEGINKKKVGMLNERESEREQGNI